MKLSLQIAAPFLFVASLTSPVLASGNPSKTIQTRNDKVILPPGGTWSKAGPLVKRNHSAIRRAVPFGKQNKALLVRAVVEERGDEGQDVEYVDCSDYDPNEDEEDDDDTEEESQGQVGTVAGASSSTASEPAWSPSPSPSPNSDASAQPAPTASYPESISIDWTNFQNPKIISPIQGALPLATSQAMPAAAPAANNPKEQSENQASPASPEKATADPDNIAPQTLTTSEGCIRFHTVVPGEVCLGVLDGSKDLQLTLEQFYEYNPVLDSTCSNLQVGWAVCTGKSS